MARASGLGLLKENERSIRKASTFGTGELILDSLIKGSKRVSLLIGGSATNDGGIGCASALGFNFYDKNNSLLAPIG
jgi:glycerate kinase